MLLNFLRSNGISITRGDCSQKVILMNNNLAIDSEEIYNHPDVIPPDRLNSYLGRQETRLKPYERFFLLLLVYCLMMSHQEKSLMGFSKN